MILIKLNLSHHQFFFFAGNQKFLEKSGLSNDIRRYSENKGNIIGICGGLQMLGTTLEDPYCKEGSKNHSEKIKGIGLLPLKQLFLKKN